MFISTGVLKAQDGGNIEFGIGMGYNYSNVSSGYESADYSSGFNFSATADFYFSSNWSIKARLMYDRKGWDNGFIEVDESTGRPSYSSYVTDFNLDYVTVPVMASWHFGNTDNWYMHFGPYVGFLVNAEETTFETDVKDDFNSTDVGIAFGIGVKIPVSDYIKLYIEYDAQGGFTEIFKEDDLYSDTITNSRGALNIGINWML